MPTTLLSDKRPIKEIWTEEHGRIAEVGDKLWQFDLIACYAEPGQMAAIPWAACYRKGKIVQRVNLSNALKVVYVEGDEPDSSATQEE